MTIIDNNIFTDDKKNVVPVYRKESIKVTQGSILKIINEWNMIQHVLSISDENDGYFFGILLKEDGQGAFVSLNDGRSMSVNTSDMMILKDVSVISIEGSVKKEIIDKISEKIFIMMLSVGYFSDKIDSLNKAISEKSESFRKLKDENMYLKGENEKSKKEINDMKDAVDKASKESKKALIETKSANTALDTQQKAYESVNKKYKEAKQRIEELEKELRDVKGNILSISKEPEPASAEEVVYKRLYDESKKHIEEMAGEIAVLKYRISGTE